MNQPCQTRQGWLDKPKRPRPLSDLDQPEAELKPTKKFPP